MKRVQSLSHQSLKRIALSPMPSALETLPSNVMADSLLEPLFKRGDFDTLRQLRATSKTLQTAVEAQDVQDYREKLSGIKQIAVGACHNLVLKDNGTVYVWGLNDEGQLGLGDKDDRFHPMPLHLPSPAKQVVAGDWHSMVLLESGEVYICGRNENLQLGQDEIEDSATMIPLNLPASAQQIVAGANHCFAVLETGQVYAWGDNGCGQLGLGHLENITGPEPLSLPSPVKKIAAGEGYTLALLENGKLYSWGLTHTPNGPHLQEPLPTPSPEQYIEEYEPVQDIVEFDMHDLVLLENGNILVWHKLCEIEDDANAEQAIAAWKNVRDGVKQYLSGDLHTLVLSKNNELYIKGENEQGALGLGENRTREEEFAQLFLETPLLEKTEKHFRKPFSGKG